jgi:ABC-type phosphate transport system substrate-binding protein
MHRPLRVEATLPTVRIAVAIASAAVLLLSACGGDDGGGSGGTIRADGSSTVGPFMQAAAERFQSENEDARDYFTAEINGEEGASRTDYSASEDDNVIVRGVEGDPGALGYLGFTYFEENEDSLKALEIDSGNGCVAPSAETAQNGEYKPLSRPLFIYVKKDSLDKPEVRDFAEFILDNSGEIADTARFIPATEEQVAEARSALAG